MHRVAMAISALLILTFAVPATAETAETATCRDEDGVLSAGESQQWIRDPGAKAGNLAAVGVADRPFLSEEAPTQSVSDGAGGGYLGTALLPLAATWTSDADLAWDERAAVTVVGTAPACVNSIAVTLYEFPTTGAAVWGGDMVAARVLVGGTEIAVTGYVDVPVSPNPNGDATYEMKFAFTGLLDDIERAGLDPADAHDLVLQVSPRLVAETPTVYVWDTVEVPANVRFNADDLTGHFLLE
jgi:hypothetical protein